MPCRVFFLMFIQDLHSDSHAFCSLNCLKPYFSQIFNNHAREIWWCGSRELRAGNVAKGSLEHIKEQPSNMSCKTYVAFPSLRKIHDNENCRVAERTFLDKGLNFNLTSVCVGMGLAYCFMLILLVARAFRRPEGDSLKKKKTPLVIVTKENI